MTLQSVDSKIETHESRELVLKMDHMVHSEHITKLVQTRRPDERKTHEFMGGSGDAFSVLDITLVSLK